MRSTDAANEEPLMFSFHQVDATLILFFLQKNENIKLLQHKMAKLHMQDFKYEIVPLLKKKNQQTT